MFKCSLKIVLRYSGYESHATFRAKKCLDNVLQNLPEKVKPYSGPLLKIIILLSACKASSLSKYVLEIYK